MCLLFFHSVFTVLWENVADQLLYICRTNCVELLNDLVDLCFAAMIFNKKKTLLWMILNVKSFTCFVNLQFFNCSVWNLVYFVYRNLIEPVCLCTVKIYRIQQCEYTYSEATHQTIIRIIVCDFFTAASLFWSLNV